MVCALFRPHTPNVMAHVFVPQSFRVGAYPPYDGSGWIVEVFLDIPSYNRDHFAKLQQCLSGPGGGMIGDCSAGDLDDDGGASFRDGDVDLRDVARFQLDYLAYHLLHARRHIETRTADFTFRTDWLDFPPGPVGSDLDANLQTVGEFLGDLPHDVSDPSKLNEPFGSLLLRCTGFIKVLVSDEVRVRDVVALPIWIEVGTLGYDGFQVDVGETSYRFLNVKWARPFYHWGPSVELVGLFPIEISYLNIYDPDATLGNERAGLEIYSWHGDGLPWPAGLEMLHETRGPGTLLPPRVIYQKEDIRPIVKGDFNADTDIDLSDFRWYAICADPDFFFLPAGCDWLDMNDDRRFQGSDYRQFQQTMTGPAFPENAGP